jgi:hypothetical protein
MRRRWTFTAILVVYRLGAGGLSRLPEVVNPEERSDEGSAFSRNLKLET